MEQKDKLPQGWTFGIITDGSCPERVNKVIASIDFAFRCSETPYEIIVVGAEEFEVRDHITFLTFNESFANGWITRKKNVVAEWAEYDKLCLMHDYVALNHNWITGFERFGDDWNSSVTPIYNANGRMFRFWCAADHDAGADMGDDREGEVPFRNMRPGIKDHARWQYLSGAYFCVKTRVFLDIPMNEELVWAQSEDIEWSRRMYKEFGEDAFSCNLNSSVILLKEKVHAPWENLPCL